MSDPSLEEEVRKALTNPGEISAVDEQKARQTLLNNKEAGQLLEVGITSLIRKLPVFGFILTRMRRVQAPHLCDTMGVRPTVDKSIQLAYSPEFVMRLTPLQLERVLEHEVMHILNEHPLRRRGRHPETWNIAADMAINQYIKELPPGCITLLEGLEPQREAEYYYSSEQVQKMGGKGGEKPQPGDSRGDHSGWDDMDGEVEMQSTIREMVKGAVEDAKKQQRGTMPAYVEEMIKRLLGSPIRWQNLLRRNISEEVSPDPEETFRKPHRRRMFLDHHGKLNDIFPGFKRAPLARLYCVFDTSGSMSADDLGECLNEIAHLSRQYGDITLIHCDAAVTKVERYTGKNEIVVHGRGGTAFTPALDHMMKQPIKEGCKPTVIFFTDGCGDNPADSGYSKRFETIWVITRNGQSPCAQFGKFIKMDEHRRA